MNQDVSDIKSKINITDFIGEYVRLQKSGAHWKALCPFHREKSPSFVVNEERQIWHCFGCGKGGDVFAFLMEMESVDFKEALKILAERTGVQLQAYRAGGILSGSLTEKNRVMEVLELATKFYEKQLWDGAGKTKILDYLRQRGLKEESIRNFRLGYAPKGWRNLLSFLLGRGYGVEEILAGGMIIKKNLEFGEKKKQPDLIQGDYYDRFRDRVIFPVADMTGRVVGFSARVSPGGDESQAKYVNTPETKLYHKSKILYGLHRAKQAIKENDFSLLVEGNMDVIAAHQAGFTNTVAVSGTALGEDQLNILKRYSENIKLLFDMDDAGRQATVRSAELAFLKEINLEVVVLPEGKDAAELIAKDSEKFAQAVKEAIPAMEYFLKYFSAKYPLSEVSGRKIFLRQMLGMVAFLGNAVEKTHWSRRVAEMAGISEKGFLEELEKLKKKNYQKENEIESDKIIGEEKKRLEVIMEKIVGLALAHENIWRELTGKGLDLRLPVSAKLKFLLEKGVEADFNFEKLVDFLREEGLNEDEQYYRKQYFEAKYQIGENGERLEVVLDDPKGILIEYLTEAEKEFRKEKQKDILAGIREAEREGNKEKLKVLLDEFHRNSHKKQE